jgi:hypothetical protein
MLKITTFSGAIYFITETGHVRGGSKDLKNGVLLSGPPVMGESLLIETPERVPLRDMPPPLPGVVPAVHSSYIVNIEEVDDELVT